MKERTKPPRRFGADQFPGNTRAQDEFFERYFADAIETPVDVRVPKAIALGLLGEARRAREAEARLLALMKFAVEKCTEDDEVWLSHSWVKSVLAAIAEADS